MNPVKWLVVWIEILKKKKYYVLVRLKHEFGPIITLFILMW